MQQQQQTNNYQLSALPEEYFEEYPKMDSNPSSENKNISSQLDTFTSDENDSNDNLNNQENQSDQIIKKMGEMLASTIFVYAYLNVSKWALNWIAQKVFKVKGEMFTWNIYKLIKK